MFLEGVLTMATIIHLMLKLRHRIRNAFLPSPLRKSREDTIDGIRRQKGDLARSVHLAEREASLAGTKKAPGVVGRDLIVWVALFDFVDLEIHLTCFILLFVPYFYSKL